MVAFARQFLSHRLLKNIGALFSGTAVARVLSALALFVLARQLGPDEFGLYISAISLAKLTSVCFSLGLDTWLLRNGRTPPWSLPLAAGLCLSLKLSIGVLWLTAVFLVSSWLNQDIFPRSILILAAFSIWFDELASTGWSVFKTALRNTVTVWLMVGSQGLFLVTVLILAINDMEVAQSYMAIRVVVSILSAAAALWLVVRQVGWEWQWPLMRPVLRSTAVFGVSEGLAIIYERADVAIIGYWLGKTAAGLYAPAVSLMTTLFLIPQAIYEVMLPVTSETYARNPLLIRRQAYRIILLSTALGIGMGLGLAVIARPLVWLVYGREYAISGELLTILSAILVLKSVSFAVAAVLTAVGWQNRRVIVQAVAAALNIGLNMALIQTVGLPGVAYVYVLTEAVLMVGYLLFYLRWQHGYPIQSVAQT